jgi:hypothetical protein
MVLNIGKTGDTTHEASFHATVCNAVNTCTAHGKKKKKTHHQMFFQSTP